MYTHLHTHAQVKVSPCVRFLMRQLHVARTWPTYWLTNMCVWMRAASEV